MPAPAHLLLMGRQAAAAEFDPLSISGCKLWLDADDASTFTYSSGVLVSQWNDKSTAANHVTQSNTSYQPSRNVTVGSRTAVAFGSNDALFRTSSVSAIGANGYTLFAVWRKTGSANTYETVINLGPNDNGAPFNMWQNGVGGLNARYPTSSNLKSSSSWVALSAQTSWCQWTFLAPDGSGNCVEWKDGTQTHSVAVGSSTPYSTTGQQIGIGSRGDRVTQLTGDIAEVLAYDAVLGTSDRQAVEDYLAGKWGTP